MTLLENLFKQTQKDVKQLRNGSGGCMQMPERKICLNEIKIWEHTYEEALKIATDSPEDKEMLYQFLDNISILQLTINKA